MAGVRGIVSLAAAALLLLVLFAGEAMSGEQRRMVGAPVEIGTPENDEGLQRALSFAVAEYNKASNDMYSSRAVRVLSAQRQIVSGIKYMMKVEIGRTTCPKPATDLQSCALHDAPHMAKHSVCDFVVYTVPWLNQTKLLKNTCE
ncbi:cystatin-like [Cuculus canorus]|uniref:cystatin-like n=1 Tax=Cuculus canorus TaxID=55661 RepID=UPI0023AA4340|nr:cystatin-like [Cuculus canorus]